MITTNLSRASGKVMIGDSWEVVAIVTVSISRLEGRARVTTVSPRNTDVIITTGGVPVDGLHAGIEVGRGTELPFADNGPDDTSTDDA